MSACSCRPRLRPALAPLSPVVGRRLDERPGAAPPRLAVFCALRTLPPLPSPPLPSVLLFPLFPSLSQALSYFQGSSPSKTGSLNRLGRVRVQASLTLLLPKAISARPAAEKPNIVSHPPLSRCCSSQSEHHACHAAPGDAIRR